MKIQALTNFTAGSSPLTRGTQRGVKAEIINDRFIPAYAGNSSKDRRNERPVSVHPRLRGELTLFAEIARRAVGSSPLTRGTLGPRVPGRTPLSVHPRLRGELTFTSICLRSMNGSSPLTRGTPEKRKLRGDK